MNKLSRLKVGDRVEIIAPASRCSTLTLENLQKLLISWGLDCIVNDRIFGNDLLCANNDEMRFYHLQNALNDEANKAIICARGGYGSMRLLSAMRLLQKPTYPKIFVGMSDITALHLFLHKCWHWPTIHGSLTQEKFSAESIDSLHALLFTQNVIKFNGQAMNKVAEEQGEIEAIITGGNLSLIQGSIGTFWQIDSTNKILFLEEIGERAYRIDRMLEHLRQAEIFKSVAAVIFGDFLGGEEPNGSSLIKPILHRFAESCSFPVIKVEGVGHGFVNYPFVLGVTTKISLGKQSIIYNNY